MTPRRSKKVTVTMSIRVDPMVATAVDGWARRTGRYIYEAVEELMVAGLASHGTSLRVEYEKAQDAAAEETAQTQYEEEHGT